jgi:hypothetical protein
MSDIDGFDPSEIWACSRAMHGVLHCKYDLMECNANTTVHI